MQAFRKIWPLAAPDVFTIVLDGLLFAATFLYDESAQVVAVEFPSFATGYKLDGGAQAAVITLSLAIPVPTFRRGTVSGQTTGAVKG